MSTAASTTIGTRGPGLELADLLLEVPGGAAFPGTGYFSAPMLTALRVAFRTLQLFPPLAARAGARLFFAPRKKRQPPLELPLTELDSFEVKGKRVPLYRFGRGKPVLLVHGWGSSVARLQGLIGALMEAGFQVVTFDMPAHGHSTARDTDVIEVNAVIQHLYRQHGPFEAGIAHSFGGTCLAHAIRERVEVKRLVLFAVPVSAMMIIDVFAEFLRASQRGARPLHGLRREPPRAARCRRGPRYPAHDRQRRPSRPPHPRRGRHAGPVRERVEFKQAHGSMTLIATSGLGHSGVIRDKTTIRACVDFVQGKAPVSATVTCPAA